MPDLTFSFFRAPRGSAAAPVNVSLPAITGTASIGQTLSVSTGGWANSPLSYAYQWKRDNVNIGGATNNTYTIPSTTGGMSCAVTASNASGSASVRASSGVPRPLYLSGDSLTGPTDYGTAVQSALDAQFGAGAWLVLDVAVSAARISEGANNMEDRAQAAVDPYIDRGYGVEFFHEYANDITGIQGGHTAAELVALLYTFAANRVAAGAGPLLYCTSPYRGAQTGGHNGDEAHAASELVRANYLSHNGTGLVDFDDATILASINANDGVHWGSDAYALCATKTVSGMLAAGLTGGCGDIHIYEPVFTNLHTLIFTPSYVYDPVNPLPYPAVATHLQVTSGSGWDVTTHTITGALQRFNTQDGYQTLYSISPAQSTGSLSGGTYILS